jgi:hypothetical protein
MWKVFAGAALLVAGIAAFIEAHSHRPGSGLTAHEELSKERAESLGHHFHLPGLSQTAYDLLRIGAWALVIVGALLVVVGLIGYWRERAA